MSYAHPVGGGRPSSGRRDEAIPQPAPGARGDGLSGTGGGAGGAGGAHGDPHTSGLPHHEALEEPRRAPHHARQKPTARAHPTMRPSITDSVADSLNSTGDILENMRLNSFKRKQQLAPIGGARAAAPSEQPRTEYQPPSERPQSAGRPGSGRRVRPQSAGPRRPGATYAASPAAQQATAHAAHVAGSQPAGPDPFASKLAGAVSILDNAAEDYKKKLGRDDDKSGMLASFQCRKFRVGKLDGQGPSSVEFYPDRVEYWFHHPEHKKVKMVMWYADMSEVLLDGGRRVLSFKIGRPLEYFTGTYDPAAPNDRLSIGFDTAEDYQILQERCMPALPA